MKFFPTLAAALRGRGSVFLDPALAQDAAPAAPIPDKGDTAWMLVSSILVLLMVVPGLALFYGGLVRTKNMLSVLTQVFAIASIAALVWVFYGYSLAFTNGGGLNDYVGGLEGLPVGRTRRRLRRPSPTAWSFPNTSICASR